MPQTYLTSQKRGGQVSLTAVYLVIAVAVIGFVVSRLPSGADGAPAIPVSEIQRSAVGSAPVRLFRPEAFVTESSEPSESRPSVTETAEQQQPAEPVVALATKASRPALIEESVGEEATEFTAKAVADATQVVVPPATPPPAPIQPLPSWSEKELLADLLATGVELDLHSGKPSLMQARADVRKVASEFKLYGERFDRRRQFQKRIRVNPGDTLPGEKELVEDIGQKPVAEHLIEEWVAARPDLEGLPLRLGDSCNLPPNEASTLMRVSRMSLAHRMRLNAAAKVPEVMRKGQADAAATTLVEDTSAIVQVLQCEEKDVRARMIKLLSLKDEEESRAAIADRALFDVSPEIRELAIHMLKLEPAEAVRKRLVDGFDHVWKPVAVNAANALVELDDELSLDDLRSKLNVPGPHSPYKDANGRWKIRELVRVNHLRNCLMCHAPVVDKSQSFAAIVPEPGRELPRMYYGDGSPSVRPDVTYITQDFSVMHELRDQKPWPDRQRFDYFVRERTLDQAEVNSRRDEWTERESFRKQAIQYAIRKLSGKKRGEAPLDESLAGR